MKCHIPIELLHQILRLEVETGRLFWRERKKCDFPKSARSLVCWNKRFADKETFVNLNRGGYLCGSIFNDRYTAHRVVWAMVHGSWPEEIIDHINNDKTDNRPENLRLVTPQQNAQNRLIGKRNKTGVLGVTITKKGRFQVTVNNKYKGIFSNIEDATNCRRNAEIECGFLKVTA